MRKQTISRMILSLLFGLPWPVLAAEEHHDGALNQVRTQVQTQLERIRYAKEVGNSAITLTRYRVADRLERAENELERQQAKLERLRDDISNQGSCLYSPCGQTSAADKATVDSALSRVEAQIRETETLISRMKRFRREVDKPVLEHSRASGLLGSMRSDAGASPLTFEEGEDEQPAPPPRRAP